MIIASAAYCPNCAALLAFEPGQSHVTCEYCEATLMLDTGRVTHRRGGAPASASAAASPEKAPIEQPDPSLFVRDAARFRTRIIEQICPRDGGEPLDLFRTIELDDDAFAIVSMRCVDSDGAIQKVPLESAFEVLSESLSDDFDPGLAANLALEELSQKPGFHQLECAICVLNPARTTASVYCAGARNAVLWVSTEEGRPILAGTSHQALERKDLAKVGSQFDNGKTVQLAAQDVIVMVSFGFLFDEGITSNAPRVMTEVLREHLGEDPQRIVTLIKNEFWKKRGEGYKKEAPLLGDLRVAAVGARLTDSAAADALKPTIEAIKTKKFEVAAVRSEGDVLLHWELYDERHAVLFMESTAAPLGEDAASAGREAVDAVLSRQNHGDFDNPREAGRRCLSALSSVPGLDVATLRIVVVHLSDQYGSVKFFASGWKPSVVLGKRGTKPDSELMLFDQGGQVSISDGSRLFFPGGLSYDGEVGRADEFAGRWYGGKSSHLFESMRLHWRTKRTEKALLKMARAAAADTTVDGAPGEVGGLMLVTGL